MFTRAVPCSITAISQLPRDVNTSRVCSCENYSSRRGIVLSLLEVARNRGPTFSSVNGDLMLFECAVTLLLHLSEDSGTQISVHETGSHVADPRSARFGEKWF